MKLHSLVSVRARALACRLFAGAGLALAAAQITSAAVTWQNIQFGGFLSQGYLDSTNNNYPVDTKGGTFDFREYALNASKTFGTHFRLAAQVYGEKFGKYGDDRPILDWAVADYNFRPEFGIQVGKLKYPRSLYSDVLDLDVVRPFVLLPQSFYDTRLRDFQASFNGAMFYGSVGVGKSTFDYKVFYGKIPLRNDSGVADYFNTTSLYANPPGATVVKLQDVRGAALMWNTPINGLRIGTTYSSVSNLEVDGAFKAVPKFPVGIDLTRTDYTAGSAEYTNGPWTINGEYMAQRIHTTVTLPSFISPPTHNIARYSFYYISIARKIGSKFEVGTYYDTTTNDTPSATTLPAATKRHDWTVAVRYDFNDHLLFKLEGHMINGEKDIFNVPGIANPTASIKNNMFLFAAKTTVSF